MTRLAEELDVLALAEELGIEEKGDALEAIVGYCLDKVGAWLNDDGPVSNIAELESLVARRLGMVFEEVESDADLERVIRKYTAMGEGVFAALKDDLDSTTFGVTIRRSKAAPNASDRLVAVIDCRGEKGARRFFTRWHEIAHFLAANKPTKKRVYRSTDIEPLERVMDEIAARVGFYESIFGPIVDAQMTDRHLSFSVVDRVRANGFGQASYQSTLFACLRRFGRPAIYVEAVLAHKVEDQRDIRQGRLFADTIPVPQLRAVTTIPNPAAKDKLFIVPRMRIPPSSIIHALFQNGHGEDASGAENLKTWEHSGGKRLADKKVWIEAKKIRDRVIAIVQL